MQIRVAKKGDIDSMVGLLEQLFSIEADFSIDQERQKRGLELLLESSTSIVLVAEINDHVVGMVTGQLVISTAEGSESLLVEDMVVDYRSRGRGVGRELERSIEAWAREKGVGRMQLLADLDNHGAFEFYRKNNWFRTNLVCLRKHKNGH